MRKIKTQHEAELSVAKGLEVICTPPLEAGVERIKVLKGQLLALFLRLQRGELESADGKNQSLLMQEELSKLVWSLDDWQIQVAARN